MQSKKSSTVTLSGQLSLTESCGPKSQADTGKLPKVEPNVTLTKGWVDDTLPPFFKENDGPIAYLHIDTDTYSPARTILSLAKGQFREGTIVLFDELIGYPFWEDGEYKALAEELPRESYEFIAFSQMQAAIRILK